MKSLEKIVYFGRSGASKVSQDRPRCTDVRVLKTRNASLDAASMYLCKCDTERRGASDDGAMLPLASEERRRQVDGSRGNENRNGPLRRSAPFRLPRERNETLSSPTRRDETETFP